MIEEGAIHLSMLVPAGKDWVDVMGALATPTIALSALALGVLNYQLSLKSRKDGLYDRRFEFYSSFTKQIFELLRETKNLSTPGARQDLDHLIDEWAAKSRFLFPETVQKELLRLKDFDFSDWIMRFDMSERPIDEIFLKYKRFGP